MIPLERGQQDLDKEEEEENLSIAQLQAMKKADQAVHSSLKGKGTEIFTGKSRKKKKTFELLAGETREKRKLISTSLSSA